ncbi:hypothetical protein DENSPDRAFT_700206 [Dentipellis sp. KUC8613]|nr:hypothetical protein DENSPDRAFT_700206 [Dentipellis sp. KUC8613]
MTQLVDISLISDGFKNFVSKCPPENRGSLFPPITKPFDGETPTTSVFSHVRPLNESDNVDFKTAAAFWAQLCEGLECLHENNVHPINLWRSVVLVDTNTLAGGHPCHRTRCYLSLCEDLRQCRCAADGPSCSFKRTALEDLEEIFLADVTEVRSDDNQKCSFLLLLPS